MLSFRIFLRLYSKFLIHVQKKSNLYQLYKLSPKHAGEPTDEDLSVFVGKTAGIKIKETDPLLKKALESKLFEVVFEPVKHDNSSLSTTAKDENDPRYCATIELVFSVKAKSF